MVRLADGLPVDEVITSMPEALRGGGRARWYGRELTVSAQRW
jgi:hypothetical protein